MPLSITYYHETQQITDPTTLVIIDEADRLKMNALEQVGDTFDQGDIGVVFIGMPGIEKRLSRYAQLYSRVGFVHAFRSLSAAQVRDLLQQKWAYYTECAQNPVIAEVVQKCEPFRIDFRCL